MACSCSTGVSLSTTASDIPSKPGLLGGWTLVISISESWVGLVGAAAGAVAAVGTVVPAVVVEAVAAVVEAAVAEFAVAEFVVAAGSVGVGEAVAVGSVVAAPVVLVAGGLVTLEMLLVVLALAWALPAVSILVGTGAGGVCSGGFAGVVVWAGVAVVGVAIVGKAAGFLSPSGMVAMGLGTPVGGGMLGGPLGGGLLAAVGVWKWGSLVFWCADGAGWEGLSSSP